MSKFAEKARDNIASSVVDRRPAFAPPSPPLLRDGTGDTVRIAKALRIPLDLIIPDPDQPRTEFDEAEMELLTEDMRSRGQLQTIRVRPVGGPSGRYMVVVGERRYRASIRAGLKAIDCIVIEGNPTAEDVLEDQMVENALRSDLKPVEQAKAYRRLLKARGITQDQLADRLHISQSSIARALALLEVPGPIQEKVESGVISPNSAYQLSKVLDPGEQAELAELVEGKKITRDELQARVRKPRANRPTRPAARTFRPASGGSIVINHPDGLEAGRLAAMLRDALAEVEAEMHGE